MKLELLWQVKKEIWCFERTKRVMVLTPFSLSTIGMEFLYHLAALVRRSVSSAA